MPPTEWGAPAVEIVRVDDDGLVLHSTSDFPVDVCFDDRRIFSFWTRRDTRGAPGSDLGRAVYRWPPALRRFLDGVTELSVVDHVTGQQLYVGDLRLGTGTGRIAVQDARGNPLGLDKSLRLSRLFDSRSSAHLEPLLAALETVVAGLETAGVRPFLAYGTLLGAVRQGAFIGHDSDADLGYVSRHRHPVDAIRESFSLQRRLRERGFSITRYSGLAFKVVVRESDGSPRGLDVFGGLLLGDHLYLMGEVGHRFREEWLHPRSEVELEGRTFPAPAEPARLLEAMYGPHWQVPDPAYKFSTPPATTRRLNGWFRGTRVGLEARHARRTAGGSEGGHSGPSSFVRWVRDREPEAVTAVDLGCGDGRDALWLASLGVQTWGLDYFAPDLHRARRRARRMAGRAGHRSGHPAGLPVTFEWVNLCELRSVLATGAELSRLPGPRVVVARHVADATNAVGRDHLLRLARMTVRGSGRLHLQVQTARTPAARREGLGPVAVETLIEQVRRSGGTVVERHDLDETEDQEPARTRGGGSTISRLVVTWDL